MSAPALTLVLPYAPDQAEAHDHAIAAACAMAADAGDAALDILQLAPTAGAVPPRAVGTGMRWWEVLSPLAGADATAQALAALAGDALTCGALPAAARRLVLVPAAPLSEAVAALLARQLQACTLGRCSALRLDSTGVAVERRAFGGRLSVAVRSEAAVCCATWRAPASATALHPLPPEAVRQIVAGSTLAEPHAQALPGADTQTRLEGASLVVSGGRGIGNAQGFELLAQLARQLGGALGGSLPAVDAGWVPVARQVGVSGRFVSPRTYVAVGISGTPQHMAGIATTTRVVAVNKDAQAPIFGLADVGVVADWRELLPLVLQQLEAAP